MNPHYHYIAARARHCCEYCRAPEEIFNFPFEVEHIIPQAKDGRDDESNLALACRSCNLFKSDHVTGLDENTNTEISLFNPRADEWLQHFEVEPETGLIQGITSTGRATVARLQMNSPAQLAARKQWMPLGIFP
ncbi:MAG: HNH endonuclease [Blastocatellia bacterium]